MIIDTVVESKSGKADGRDEVLLLTRPQLQILIC